MFKFFGLFFILTILCSQSVFAVTSLPSETVSVVPASSKTGTPVKLNALVYNNQKDTVIFTIEFRAGDTLIGKPVVSSIATLSAKTISVDWKVPEKQTQVNVVVTSAINKQRQDVTSLHGLLGSLLVGSDVNNSLNNLAVPSGKLQEIYLSTKEKIEVFRKKQALHFANLRDKTKIKLNIEVNSEIVKNLTPDYADMAPQVLPGDDVKELKDLNSVKADNPMDYGTLIFATAMASFFSIIWMFYGALVLLLFIILRSFFRIFI